MTSSLYELALIGVILVGIAIAVWKGGQANPVGTGSLQRVVSGMRGEVDSMKGRLKTLDSTVATKQDVLRLDEKLAEEAKKMGRVFETLDRVDDELAALARSHGARNAVIEALSDSVRRLSEELKSHQQHVAARLTELSSIPDKVEANSKAIEKLSSQMPAIREAQRETASDVKHIGRQVERLYDFLIPEGMKK